MRTEGELEDALKKTRDEKTFSLIEVHTDRWDATPALKVAGEEMLKKNAAWKPQYEHEYRLYDITTRASLYLLSLKVLQTDHSLAILLRSW